MKFVPLFIKSLFTSYCKKKIMALQPKVDRFPSLLYGLRPMFFLICDGKKHLGGNKHDIIRKQERSK